MQERFDKEYDIDLCRYNEIIESGDDEASPSLYIGVNTVSGLLKLYLRNLPHLLFGDDQFLSFKRVADENHNNPVQISLGFRELIKSGVVPHANVSLMYALFELLVRINENNKFNKMNLRNLCIVFSPTLNIPISTVSYTHLDVYKRQDMQKVFSMTIEYYKRSGPIQKDILGYNAKYHSGLDDPNTWKNADLIILALPGTASTNDIINRERLSWCKDGVRIVNVGRGTCVDEDALLDALESGKVASCGLDVFKNEETGVKQELLRRWDVTALPHIGSTVADMVVKQTIITLVNVQDIFVEGGEGKYVLN